MSRSHSQVILKIPISPVEPNLFFSPLRSLISSNLSHSKYKTTSTRCSRLFGPATAPSLVICQIMIKLVLYDFAYFWRVSAMYFIWLILPGVPLVLFEYITLIESTITRSNCWFLRDSLIFSKFDSHRRETLSPLTQSLLALAEICPLVSSHEIYKTFFSLSHPAICRDMVDFPIPGSHERSMRLPATIHHPSTLLSSLELVSSLCSSWCVLLRDSNSFLFHLTSHFFSLTSLNSTSELHSRHELHCHCHLRNSVPQLLQTYILEGKRGKGRMGKVLCYYSRGVEKFLLWEYFAKSKSKGFFVLLGITYFPFLRFYKITLRR